MLLIQPSYAKLPQRLAQIQAGPAGLIGGQGFFVSPLGSLGDIVVVIVTDMRLVKIGIGHQSIQACDITLATDDLA